MTTGSNLTFCTGCRKFVSSVATLWDYGVNPLSWNRIQQIPELTRRHSLDEEITSCTRQRTQIKIHSPTVFIIFISRENPENDLFSFSPSQATSCHCRLFYDRVTCGQQLIPMSLARNVSRAHKWEDFHLQRKKEEAKYADPSQM